MRRVCSRRWLWLVCVAAGAVALPCAAEPFVHIGQGAASKWGSPTVGTGAVVTWGFVPDGTAVDPLLRIDPVGSPDDVGVVGTSNLSQLRGLIDTNHGLGAFDAAIRSAFDTWSAVADVQFVEVTDPGTTLGQQGSTTPNIRIAAFDPLPGHFFEGTGAIGFGPPGFPNPVDDFPESGDVFFNLRGNKFGGNQTPFHIASGTEDVTPVDFFNFGDDLEGLFLHELGHAAIGLAHPPWNGDDPDRRVMYVGEFGNPQAPPCCTAMNRELHPDDIAGAHFVYGTPTIPGDFNGNGQVEQGDLDLVLQNWGTVVDPVSPLPGWNKRQPFGTVDQAELDQVLQHWGNVAAPGGAMAGVPEPAGVFGLGLAVGLAFQRRRG